MKILEFEAKAVLREHGLQIPDGEIVTSPKAAATTTERLARPVVLKAQIPIGGRMKAGGIHFAETPAAAQAASQHLFDSEIRTFPVTHILVEEKLASKAELFLGLIYDATERTAVVLGSLSGGIDVEDDDGIVRCPFPTCLPVPSFVGREVALQLGCRGHDLLNLARVITSLIERFLTWDALLLEINPLVMTPDGLWWVADVHLELDDDALFRQSKLCKRLAHSRRILSKRSDFEERAHEIDRTDHRGVAGRLIAFDGDLGLLIGGGGASLTTFDAVLDAGLNPANYCEIGGNPSVWKVAELTKLIMSQTRVTHLAVIMNIVSNTRADLVARGVIKGLLELGCVPKEVIAVFRVPGSWEDECRHILEQHEIAHLGRESAIDNVVNTIRCPS